MCLTVWNRASRAGGYPTTTQSAIPPAASQMSDLSFIRFAACLIVAHVFAAGLRRLILKAFAEGSIQAMFAGLLDGFGMSLRPPGTGSQSHEEPYAIHPHHLDPGARSSARHDSRHRADHGRLPLAGYRRGAGSIRWLRICHLQQRPLRPTEQFDHCAIRRRRRQLVDRHSRRADVLPQ